MTCATEQTYGRNAAAPLDEEDRAPEAAGMGCDNGAAAASPPGAAKPPRNFPRRAALALVVGVAVMSVSPGSYSLQHRSGAEAAISPPEAHQAPQVPVFSAVAPPSQSTRSFVGRVQPQRTVDIAFQVSGQIVELPLEEGARVAAGTVIARLDPEDYRLSLSRNEAMRDLARAEYERIREMVERRVAPQAQLDRASAEIAQAEVAVDQARRALDQTEIVAPFDALVGRRMAEAWSNVTPAAPVIRLQDVTRFLVEISLPEELAARVRLDPDAFEAVARFPALPDLELPLASDRFVTEVDPVSQTYTVELSLNGDDPRILPGMTASVELRMAAPDAGVLVPVSAIDGRSSDAPKVWVVGADGAVSRRTVALGTPRGDRIMVVEGIEPGERIVEAGWWRLDEGSRIRPANI